MSKRIEVPIGKKFHSLTVIEEVEPVPYTSGKYPSVHRMVRAKCDCGKESVTALGPLIQGKTRSCGCAKGRSGSKAHGWKGVGGVSGLKMQELRTAARVRGLPVTVDAAYLWKLYQRQHGRCAYTNFEITLPEAVKGKVIRGTASVDRIDSQFGYIVGNVHWVHKDINPMKYDFTPSRFIELCKAVVNNLKEGRTSVFAQMADPASLEQRIKLPRDYTDTYYEHEFAT